VSPVPASLRARLQAVGLVGEREGQFRLVEGPCRACGAAQVLAVPVGEPAACIACGASLESDRA
jgi:hypothetical protein